MQGAIGMPSRRHLASHGAFGAFAEGIAADDFELSFVRAIKPVASWVRAIVSLHN
jgi:homoaconitase/3-isopropylmalate dehydratase large subunit